MSNKLIVAGLLLAMGSAAWAEASPTFAEITEIDAKVKKQELLNKLNEVIAKSRPAVAAGPGLSAPAPALPLPPVPSAQAPGVPAPAGAAGAPAVDMYADVRVMAVYGVGENLFAEVQTGGLATTVSVRGNRKIGPWTVIGLTPYELTLSSGESVPAKGKTKAKAPVIKVISIADNSIASAPANAPAGPASPAPEEMAAKAKAASKLYPTSMPELPIPMPPRAKE